MNAEKLAGLSRELAAVQASLRDIRVQRQNAKGSPIRIVADGKSYDLYDAEPRDSILLAVEKRFAERAESLKAKIKDEVTRMENDGQD